MSKNEILEMEREKLHQLIKIGAPKEEIQHQSEILDKQVVACYSIPKGCELC